ncbi:MAG: hypothetical protein ABI591_00930 [Kofleriaceae bacterium]
MKSPANEVRTVIVQSPSVAREAGMVVRAVAHILIWSAALMTASRYHSGKAGVLASSGASTPDIQLFRDLDPDAQRLFRASLEGLTEAEDVRSRSGEWPTVEQLAARKIPPFAADPLDHAGYRWRLLRDGTLVDYVGTPDAASLRPSFVISILEPEPGMAVDPQAFTDETHHKLRDGTLLHVGVYSGPHTLTSPMATPPFEDGWRRITTYNP